MKTRHFLPFLLILAAFGCQGEKSANQQVPETKPPVKDATEGSPTAKLEVPANLQHDGYRFYGLNKSEPFNLEISGTALDGTLTGSQKHTLVSVDGDKATFAIERTGGLVTTVGGTQDIELRPDGVYATTVQGEKLNPPQMELPAVLEPGKVWSINSSFKSNGSEITIKATNKVVRKEKVKTKAGEFDAWLITNQGQYTVGTNKLQVEVKTWYAEGVGEVKLVMATKDASGKAQNLSLEATK